MADLTHTRCTIQLAKGGFCDAPSHPDMPFPICARHAIRVWKRLTEHLESQGRDPLARARMVNGLLDGFEAKRKAEGEDPRVGRVYYVQVGDLIKIGTTIRMRQRMSAYGPQRKLLATEFGDYEVESARHRQFAHLLEAGREWFRPGPDLIAHINDLRKADGAPPLKLAA